MVPTDTYIVHVHVHMCGVLNVKVFCSAVKYSVNEVADSEELYCRWIVWRL